MKTLLFVAIALSLGACAGQPPAKAEAEASPSDITLEKINAAIDDGTKLQNEKGEEMICRKEAKTGSRLARETVCMTKAEWLKVAEESQRATQKSMRLGKVPHGT